MKVFNAFCKTVIIIFYCYFGGRLLIDGIFPAQAEQPRVETVAVKVAQTVGQPSAAKAKQVAVKKKALVKVWYGICSWYGPGFHGKLMASGKAFDMNNPIHAAHRTLSFGTKLEITNLANQKKLVVTILDRGPFTKNKQGKFSRDLDLSSAAADLLGFKNAGLAELKITKLN